MFQLPNQARMQELQDEVKKKADEQAKSNARIEELEAKLKKKTSQDVKSKARIQELESTLSASQNELRAASEKLEQQQLADVTRLKKSSDWPAAASILEALVKTKETKVAESKAIGDQPKANELSKVLCSQQRNLGELYMKANDLEKAEIYTKKAYDERLRLLRPDSQEVQYTQQQLCKILRKTGNKAKVAEAQIMYLQVWIRGAGKHDEFILECGHELGCLYYEQKDYDAAVLQLRKVWEARRAHSKSSERKLAMSTAGKLLSALSLQGKETDRLTTLELLWEQHTGNLAGKPMLQHADELANVYWSRKDYAKAEPIMTALWAARQNDLQGSGGLSKNEKEIRLGQWFVTGYRYANTLTKVGGNSKFVRARAVLEELWNSRAKLPASVGSDVKVIQIADYYAAALLHSENSALAEEVAGTAWRAAKDIDSSWDINESVLYVGEQYAKALNVNGNSYQAKEEYKVLFAAWKKLSGLERGDKVLAENAIKAGRALLSVLRARGKAGRKQLHALELEIAERERALSSNAQRRLAF